MSLDGEGPCDGREVAHLNKTMGGARDEWGIGTHFSLTLYEGGTPAPYKNFTWVTWVLFPSFHYEGALNLKGPFLIKFDENNNLIIFEYW